jgi:hypothetical protein
MRQNKLNIRLYGYIIYSNMRVKLSEKYKDERENICNRIIEILDLDENNSFLLNDLDNDTDKQNAILDMKDEIKKYFAVSCLSSFKPNAKCKRPHISIIRGILKQQGYTFQGNSLITSLNDGKYTSTTKYRIFRNK